MTLLGNAKIEVLKGLAAAAPPGVLVEVGVYCGGSLLEIAKASGGQQVYGFDTFSGMPKLTWGPDEFHRPGEFSSRIEDVQALFQEYRNVKLVAGIFPASGLEVLEYERIAFAHLDMDHWRGTLDALGFLWPRMVPGGCILFDDYAWKKCPGIAPVVDTWAAARFDCDRPTIVKNQAVLLKK